jgi:hypothetical protein
MAERAFASGQFPGEGRDPGQAARGLFGRAWAPAYAGEQEFGEVDR